MKGIYASDCRARDNRPIGVSFSAATTLATDSSRNLRPHSKEEGQTMKYITLLALLILGCGNKPKPQPWVLGPVHLYNGFSVKSLQLPPEGFTYYVTPAQWQAVQGLYHSSPTCDGQHHWKLVPEDDPEKSGDYYPDFGDSTMVWYCESDGLKVGDTFPPSGDVK
jgi:hypothetical protein